MPSAEMWETVCTAGVRSDGSWVRIYPVPFRRLEEAEQYRKPGRVQCDLVRRSTDPRPETRREVDFVQLDPIGHMGTVNN